MVDVLGHLGMALVWLAPVWYLADRTRTVVAFVAASLWFGMLPDVDLLLSKHLATVQHHGVFHTVVAVTLLAAALGPVLAWTLRRFPGGETAFAPASTWKGYGVGFLGVWVPSLSHLFADVLSAPDVSQAIEPLWPVYTAPLSVDVLWYKSFWATWALLAAGVGLHVGLWYWRTERADSPDGTATP